MLDIKQLKPQYITNETGEKTAVILPIIEERWSPVNSVAPPLTLKNPAGEDG
ncbi:MAG: hypothetical protein HUU32_05450 [Calditrichaceae bacterium]|nr:hypothetical protein [Calditrichia bacterium]NUQ40821.1 hypothetical protein [Calditrichaceae bacterium]